MKWEGNAKRQRRGRARRGRRRRRFPPRRRPRHRHRHHRRSRWSRGWIFGINPLTMLGVLSGGGGAGRRAQQAPAPAPPANDPTARFVSTVLADTEDVWTRAVPAGRHDLREPKLVLFRGATPTACGTGQSAMGPFYCPGDQKVYIDLQLLRDAATRLGAPGDFAQAYVIAHEVGHHVQNLLGITEQGGAMRRRASQAQAQRAVACASSCRPIALPASGRTTRRGHAAGPRAGRRRRGAQRRIADRRRHDAAQVPGTVVPESFTHGTSEQRVSWFKRGLQTGSVQQCNTFDNKL